MSKHYEISPALTTVFDQIMGASQEIYKEEDWEYDPNNARQIARQLEIALGLLERYAHPAIHHVKATGGPDGIWCERCGEQMDYRVLFREQGRTTATEFAEAVRRFANEHAGCLPLVAIRDAIIDQMAGLRRAGEEVADLVIQVINIEVNRINGAK